MPGPVPGIVLQQAVHPRAAAMPECEAYSPRPQTAAADLRWMTEKLSSDTSVRMVSPAHRCDARRFLPCCRSGSARSASIIGWPSTTAPALKLEAASGGCASRRRAQANSAAPAATDRSATDRAIADVVILGALDAKCESRWRCRTGTIVYCRRYRDCARLSTIRSPASETLPCARQDIRDPCCRRRF